MSQISAPEAHDLLNKLLSERIPLRVSFKSPAGTRSLMPGFVDSLTEVRGVAISVSGPPIDVDRGFVNFRPFDRNCDFSYGEKREIPKEEREGLPGSDDESVLIIRFLDFGETILLFFTL